MLAGEPAQAEPKTVSFGSMELVTNGEIGLTCPSCEAVFAPGGSFVVCPNCGMQALPRAPGAKLFLLDSNAYDPLVETAEVQHLVVDACNAGKVELLMTHVQYGELFDIAVLDKRNRIFAIPFVIASTYGMIVGTSQVGLARLGEPDKIEAIRNYSDRHSRDALLATTAQHEGATLVTNERRLTNFACRTGIEVWSAPRFIEYVRALSTGPEK